MEVVIAERTEIISHRDLLARLHEEILMHSFPPRELVSLAALAEGVDDGRNIVIAMRDGHSWSGVAVLERYPPNAVLLGYLAVSSQSRGKGLGERLLDAALRIVRRDSEWLLAEIEMPGVVPGRPEYGDATRRARFYQRAGAKALAMEHWQPPTGPGQPFVRFQLIVIPTNGMLGDVVEAAPVVAFERDYLSVHGESAELGKVMASIGHEATINLVPLDSLYS